MKITKMRIKGQKPGGLKMNDVLVELKHRFDRAGFQTNVGVISDSGIKIGLWMRTFILDTTKHELNLQCNPYQQKLTKLPNWDQRVKFNDIVNSVLNKFKVSANVKSGPFIIREGLECMTEYHWQDQKPSWIYQNEQNGYYITSVNEKEFIEARRLKRLKKQRENRAKVKQCLNQRPHLSIVS